MAQIIIDIPNPVVTRVLDAIASEYNYNAGTDGTKAAFAKKQVIEFLKRTVKGSEGSVAVKTAADNVSTDVNSNIVIS